MSLKHYIANLKGQLQQSLSIGVAELQNKRNALVAELDNHLEEALNQLYIAQKEKERVLKDKDQEVDCYLKEINSASKTLQLKLKAEPKAKFVQNYTQTVAEAEEALDIWAPEPELNSDWASLQLPSFTYSIVGNRSIAHSISKTTSNGMSLELKEKFIDQRTLPDINETFDKKTVALSPIKSAPKDAATNPPSLKSDRSSCVELESRPETPSVRSDDDRKDVIILELMKSYRELETLYQWTKKGVPIPKHMQPMTFRRLKAKVTEDGRLPLEGFKSELPTRDRDNSTATSADGLLKQNIELASRVERLEKTIEHNKRTQTFSSRTSIERSPIRGISPQTCTIEHSRPNSYRSNLERPFSGDDHTISSRGSYDRISISTLMSDKVEAPPRESESYDSQETYRVYIPQGYPPYSCYYSIRINPVSSRQTVTTDELLNSLMRRMQLEDREKYILAFQVSRDASQKPFYSTERPADVLKQYQTKGNAWPRVYLKTIV